MFLISGCPKACVLINFVLIKKKTCTHKSTRRPEVYKDFDKYYQVACMNAVTKEKTKQIYNTKPYIVFVEGAKKTTTPAYDVPK